MITKIMVNAVNPINWIGFLPQESIKKKDAQYPGIKPAAERL
jgi:hypothetical protein